jgi:hypothetical protein
MHRLVLFALCIVTAAESVRAAAPALLLTALKKTGDDADHWAYTETSSMRDDKGKTGGETVVRFDPSKPYPEQYTPLKIEGKPPTAKQLKEYRQRGEKRGEALERDAPPADSAGEPESINLNGAKGVVDLENARVVTEAGGSITYEVPLKADAKHSLPVEKFRLTIRVNQARQELENASVTLLAPWRVKLIAKINQGELSVDFATIDPKFPPVLSTLAGNLAASIFFIKEGGTFEQKRTDQQHVKPFHERFDVKIGPLKALPF